MSIVRAIDLGGAQQLSVGVRRENTEGQAAPAMAFEQPGKFRFRWKVLAGSRTMTIMVQQAANAAPFPTLTVKANPDCGVLADVVGTAPAGAGWKTIGPVTIVPSVLGAVWVELEATYNGAIPPSPCYWDNIIVT